MGDFEKRRAIRRRLGDKLRKFHQTLLTGVAADAEGFLRRLMHCPACGDEMVPSISKATINPRYPDYLFACAKCGVSYFAESYLHRYANERNGSARHTGPAGWTIG
jgi:transcription elongation factor Elf1